MIISKIENGSNFGVPKYFGRGFIRSIAVLIGLVGGTVLAALLGQVDLAAIGHAPMFHVWTAKIKMIVTKAKIKFVGSPNVLAAASPPPIFVTATGINVKPIVVITLILAVQVFGRGFIRSIAVLIGLVGGTVLAALLGRWLYHTYNRNNDH
jgi:xanthine/uracil permease